MDSSCRTSAPVLLLWSMAALVCAGCSDAVRFAHETDNGGVVTYLYKEERGGPLGSPHRAEALKAMDQKCPAGYVVMRDGEVKGSASLSGAEGREGDITGRRWGIQFRCK